jgi:hypothetical protein
MGAKIDWDESRAPTRTSERTARFANGGSAVADRSIDRPIRLSPE